MPWYMWGFVVFVVTAILVLVATLYHKMEKGEINKDNTDKENNKQISEALIAALVSGILWPVTWTLLLIIYGGGTVLFLISKFHKSSANKEYEKGTTDEK